MITRNVFRQITSLAQYGALAFAVFSAEAADSGIVTFQSSENSSVLIGHWRKTTFGYTGPMDEHLVLHANGSAENWTGGDECVIGRWSVEGKTLTLWFGDNKNSRPFTIYEGQLVFPNISDRRQFWEKIE
jgi:hypothetical protein